jgi:site-specific DNA-methyltransferase (adenine-specific)/modification methylase
MKTIEAVTDQLELSDFELGRAMQIVLPLKINYKRWDNMKLGKFELNHIYHMDCLEGMKLIPDKSIDMILCDLPYGTTQNKWDTLINFENLWSEYRRIIKSNGVIALTSHGIFTAKSILSNESMFKYKITWVKSKSTNFLNAKKQPLRKHEDICIFYAKQPTYNPQMMLGTPYNKGVRKDRQTGSYGEFKPVQVQSYGERYPVDVVYFKTAESEGKVLHPTQKPVALFEYLIKTYTNEGEIVLDNCIGSGTTAIAALKSNRKFIGFEIEEKYIEIANKRILEVLNEG